MSRAAFRRPDGRYSSYMQWLAEVSARWNVLSAAEQRASRTAAAERFGAAIRAQSDGGPTLMHLYDEIGYFGIWPPDVADALSDVKGDLEVHLNSPGGSVFDGLTIYSALREHRGNVNVVVDGLAASAASFIAMAASPGQLEIQPNGTVMIHEAWGGCIGSEADMRATADVLAEQTANIASIYAERGNRTAVEYRDLMAAETWAVGQKAVDLGLADRVRGAAPAGSLPVAASLPWQVTIVADGADEGSWDGPAAMSAAASSDDPSAAYAAICAGRRDGDPAKQSSWALPHHEHPGAPPNRAGVNNAVARLPQTQGLTNKDAAEAHLKAHQSAMGSGDSDASDHAELPAWITALTAKEAARR